MTVQLPTQVKNDTRIKMTFAEYDEWSFQQEARTEWVNGEVEFKVSVSTIHQNVIHFLIELLGLYIRLFGLGRLSGGPAQVRVGENALREPDVFFVSTERLHLLTEKRMESAPDLAIEIVSAGSVLLDRQIKWQEYRDAGVKEYWIIDPRPGKERADFYQLENDEYVLAGTEDDERYESKTLKGFWLNPSWLWDIGNIQPLLKIAEISNLSADELFQKLA